MSKKVYEILQEKVLEKLEAGTIPWARTWDQTGGFPRNIITNRPYIGFNHMMLLCQGFASPYWMTWKQAKKLGGCIKAEESKNYTIITFWKVLVRENEDTEKEESFPMIRYYKVWNLDQTKDVKLKWDEDVMEELTPKERIQACEDVVNGMREMPEVVYGRNPCYMPNSDRIGMPEMDTFHSSEEFYATIFHEMAHSTKAIHRMNREKPSKAKEELIAEMTALFLCGTVGIATKTIENQAAYVKSWASRIRENDIKMVIQAASVAQRVSNWILNINEFVEMAKAS